MGVFDDQLELARRGDEAALQEILQRNLPGLRAFVRLQCGPALTARESPSDLVQSVCREVLQHLDAVDTGGEAGFRRWLYTTAMRKIRNRAAFWQAERRDRRRETPQEPATERALAEVCRTLSTPSALAQGNELVERVEVAFGQLSEDEREVILLARVLGHGHQQIAELTGRSAGACRVLLHRALGRLSALLDADHA